LNFEAGIWYPYPVAGYGPIGDTTFPRMSFSWLHFRGDISAHESCAQHSSEGKGETHIQGASLSEGEVETRMQSENVGESVPFSPKTVKPLTGFEHHISPTMIRSFFESFAQNLLDASTWE
jgi:hypothetical protein